MNAPTSGAAARKPLASKSELEAEISNLLEQEGQTPTSQEDDGERIRSLVARLTSIRSMNSKDWALICFPQFESYKNS